MLHRAALDLHFESQAVEIHYLATEAEKLNFTETKKEVNEKDLNNSLWYFFLPKEQKRFSMDAAKMNSRKNYVNAFFQG